LNPEYDEELGDQFSVTWKFVEEVPVPDSAIVVGEFVALLVMVTLPLAFPAVVGSNTTEKDVLCPALSVRGKASPLTEKPVPATLSLDSETLALPELVSVTVCVELVPVVTLPKLTEVGEAAT
jgi:hypothetical protein